MAYCLYGKLNKEVINKDYIGIPSSTNIVKIDNEKNTIQVDSIKNKASLIINGKSQSFIYDGSKDITIDIASQESGATKQDVEDEAKAREQADNQLQANINQEQSERVSNFNDLTSKIISETNERKSNDNLLSEKINTEREARISSFDTLNQSLNKETSDRKTDFETLTNALDQEKTARYDEDNALKQSKLDAEKANVDLLSDINLIRDSGEDADPDYLAISNKKINIVSGAESISNILLPLANDKLSGLMSSQDVKLLTELNSKVATLENTTKRLLYKEKSDPSASDINTFVTSLGYQEPFAGIAVVVWDTKHIWYYYETNGWIDDGVDVVSNFTNETAGVIKGSTEDGKIYAETTGIGSVNGWSEIKSNISQNTTNIENNKSLIEKEIADRQEKDTSLEQSINKLNTDKVDKNEIPTKLPNPYSLTIKQNNQIKGVYDGSEAKEITIDSGINLTNSSFESVVEDTDNIDVWQQNIENSLLMVRSQNKNALFTLANDLIGGNVISADQSNIAQLTMSSNDISIMHYASDKANSIILSKNGIQINSVNATLNSESIATLKEIPQVVDISSLI